MIKRPGGRPLCAAGIRAWCDRHGVDWPGFIGPGVPIEAIKAIDDHYARRLIELAEKERADGQQ